MQQIYNLEMPNEYIQNINVIPLMPQDFPLNCSVFVMLFHGLYFLLLCINPFMLCVTYLERTIKSRTPLSLASP